MSRTVVLIDSEGRPIQVDDVNGNCLVMIRDTHHYVHEGLHFECADIDEDVDIAGPKYWHLKAPDTSTRVHLLFMYEATRNGKIEFFTEPTLTDDGTALSCVNNDDNSSNEAEMLVYRDPTVSADGTRKCGSVVGTDGTNALGNAGGLKKREQELILKQNTSYLIKFTAKNDNTRVSLCLSWYEVSV